LLSPECSKCKNVLKNFVPARGPKPCKILIVGRNPGRTEALTHLPFTGQAGYVLNGVLRGLKLRPQDVNITNLVKCPTPKDIPPGREVWSLCSKLFLKKEIDEVDPLLIISLGEECLNFFSGRQHIMNWRGFCELYPIEGRQPAIILYTIHPAFIKRGNPEFFQVLLADFQKGLQTLKEGLKDEKFETKINPPLSEVSAFLRKWSTGGFTFDIETGPWEIALNPRLGNIKSIAFCGQSDTSLSVEWKEPYTDLVKDFLERSETNTVAQNAPFDIGFLRSKGCNVAKLVFDTSLASHTLCSDLPKALNFQRSIYTNIPPYKSKERGKLREVTQYQGCLDALVTYRSWKRQATLLKEEGLDAFYYNWLHPKLKLITTLNLRGIRIDKRGIQIEMVKRLPEYKALIKEFWGLGFNPNSPTQVGEYLVKKLHIPLFETTPTGRWKVSEEILLKARRACKEDQKAFLDKLLHYSNLEQVISTFLKGMWKRLEDEKVYTSYQITGTATGRLSSVDPNLQNIPPELRHIFIPRTGNVFIGFDYKQLELTVAALLAEEQTLLDIISSGEDIHDNISCQLFKIEPGTATLKQRSIAKAVVFGTLYGQTERNLAQGLEILTDQARFYQNQVMLRFPNLVKWRERIKLEAQERGCLKNVYGRIRYFFEDKVTTKAYNFPVQSAASDFVLDTLDNLNNLSFEVNLPVHDFGLVEHPQTEVEAARPSIEQIVGRSVPQFRGWAFKYKMKVGNNWREVS